MNVSLCTVSHRTDWFTKPYYLYVPSRHRIAVSHRLVAFADADVWSSENSYVQKWWGVPPPCMCPGIVVQLPLDPMTSISTSGSSVTVRPQDVSDREDGVIPSDALIPTSGYCLQTHVVSNWCDLDRAFFLQKTFAEKVDCQPLWNTDKPQSKRYQKTNALDSLPPLRSNSRLSQFNYFDFASVNAIFPRC